MGEPQSAESGPSETAPPAKTPKSEAKKQLTVRERKILVNIYKYIRRTSNIPKKKMEVYSTISQIMEVSVALVRNTIKYYEETQEIMRPKERPGNRAIITKLDECVLTAIKLKVDQLTSDGELPTIEKVLSAVNNDKSLPNFSYTTMYRIMKKWKPKKRKKGSSTPEHKTHIKIVKVEK